MAEVNTSIYGNINKPADPFAQFGGMLGIQKQGIENKLLQLQLGGNVAGGQAYLDAIDPATGQIDPAKLKANLDKTPYGGVASPTVVPNAINAQGGQISNQKAKVDLNQQSITNLGSIWGSRLQRSKSISRDDLTGDVLDAVATGRITREVGTAVIAGLRDVPDDQLRSYATGTWVQSLPPSFQTGTPGPNGAPTTVTGGQLATQAVGGVAPTPASPVAAPPTPAAPPGATSVAPPAVPVPPVPSGTVPGPVVTGIGPSTSAALSATGVDSSAQFTGLRNVANAAPDRQAALRNMETAGSQFTGGPFTAQLKDVINGVNQIFGTKYAAGSAAAIEEYGKLANQVALAQSSALGITDLTTQTAMGANPNTSLSSLGSKRIISMLKGNEDAITVKNREATKWLASHAPDTFGAFSTDFNQHYDPRVFQSVYWDDKAKADAVATMSGDELTAFKNKYNYAVEQGWIPDPRKPDAK